MWTGRMLCHPGFGMLNNLHAAALDASPAGFRLRMLGEVVVVIEAAVESRGESLAIENDRADESGCVVGVFLEQFGDGGMTGRKRNGEIGHAVRTGQQTGENAGVGSVCNRTGGKRCGEADAVVGQSIEGGRLYSLVAVAVDVISPKRVDGDQENIGWGLGRRGSAGSESAK